ncbi:MAG: radical SAM family heme chaperone HemW [Clostridia bacterium]|nr:radical SAM family heme chaperone HemW [Clostridia bacterium]
MEEKDLEQVGADVSQAEETSVDNKQESKVTWKQELALTQEEIEEETVDQKIERRLEEIAKRRKEEKEEQEREQKKALWASRKKIKKFDTIRYREQKCKEWEVRIVQQNMRDERLGLYIHIPFCDRKCDYCDFVSYSMGVEAQHEFKDALFKEIEMYRKQCTKKTFNSIYIGGGTPSVMYEGFIYELSRKIYSTFHFEGDIEFTIEVNPNSVTSNKLMEYLRAGVNRVSVGVQCIDSKILANVGRFQTIENIENTFNLLHQMGFINTSADVMIGLPHQSLDAVRDTIDYLVEKNVKHISVYTLQVEENTQLYKNIKMGKIKPLGDEACIKMYETVNKMLKKAGFVRYEVSNFAIPTYESRHNFKYWKDVDYLGLGVSAHSFLEGYRFNNTPRLDEYIEMVNEGKLPVVEKEFIRDSERRTEYIMLSLRLATGLNLKRFRKRFNEDLLKTRASQIQALIKAGYVYIEDGFLKISPQHVYVSNRIILELL